MAHEDACQQKSVRLRFNTVAQTLLIAEDQPGVAGVVSAVLSRSYSLLMATGGHQAIAMFNDHHEIIDLALLDAFMPDLSGISVAEYIRQRSDLPIIVMSGFDDHFSKTWNFLNKPFLPSQLTAKIASALEQYKTAHGGH
jgi:two-component system OmpR family response regulator